MSTLASTSLAANAIGIAATPILTRLYSPQDYGLLAVYTAAVMLGSNIVSLRLELALPLIDDDVDRGRLLAGVSVAVLTLTAFLSLVLAVSGPWLLGMYDVPEDRWLLWLMPAGWLLSAGFQVARYLAISYSDFAPVARATIGQAGIGTVVQLAASSFGAIGLVLGAVAHMSVGTVGLVRRQWTRIRVTASEWTVSSVIRVLRAHSALSMSATASGVLSAAAVASVPILIGTTFGVAAAGLAALTIKVLGLPARHVGGAIADVMYGRARGDRDSGEMAVVSTAVLRTLIALSMPAVIFVAVWGGETFAWVFGEEWREAGVLAQVSVTWFAVQFIASPLSRVLFVYGANRWNFLWQLAMLILRVGSLLIPVRLGLSLTQTLLVVSLTSTAMYVVLLAKVVRLTSADIVTLSKVTATWVLVGVGCSALPLAVTVRYETASTPLMVLSGALMLCTTLVSARSVLRAPGLSRDA